MNSFVIKSSHIVTPAGIIDGYVTVQDGVITKVAELLTGNNQTTIIDIADHYLLPGVVDTHVHINEPGRTDWEGFQTATKAAITGGVTTLVDMPLNASPVTTTVKAFDEKLASTKRKLYADVGFWGGVVPGNEAELEGLIAAGVLGFKAFLTHSGIDEFPNVTEDDLRKAMPIIAAHNLPLLVHCEITNEQVPVTTNNQSYQQYLASRPKAWENDAIRLMLQLCEEYQCHVHIVHLSSAEALPMIADAKQRGLPLTVETGQHYLYFTAEDINNGNTAFKCAPPIREKANNDQLWQALASGVIDFVATDHSPAPPGLKAVESGDLTSAWGGIASIQFALPVLWTAAHQRGYRITDVVKWLCEKPAELAGLSEYKGKIAEGYHADLIVFDGDSNFTITEEIIKHRHKVTPYLHQRLSGVVKQTYIKGKLVFDEGRYEVASGKIIIAND